MTYIKTLLKKLYMKLFVRVYRETEGPYAPREWVTMPMTQIWKGALLIGIGTFLVESKGEQREPYLISSLDIGIQPNPLKWECSIWHGYYDGPHCSYNFGPFSFHNNVWLQCRKCEEE